MSGCFGQKNTTITSDELTTGFIRCRKMALDIIKLYISLLGQFFTLSDISIASTRKPGQSASQASNLGQTTGHSEAAVPDFVLRNANSLVTCHYASKILAEIVESAGEIDILTGSNSGGMSGSSPLPSADLGQEAKKAMRDFVESCRWRLEEAICETWSQGNATMNSTCKFLIWSRKLLTSSSCSFRCKKILSIGRLDD